MYSSYVGSNTLSNLWIALQWRHDDRDGVSDHQPHNCLLNRLFMRKSKKTSKLRFTGLCVGNSPVTDEFPTQRVSNAKMLPFDDVIMNGEFVFQLYHPQLFGIFL